MSSSKKHMTYYTHRADGQPIKAYSAPNTQSEVVTEFPNDHTVHVTGNAPGEKLGDVDTWFEIKHKGRVVYIHSLFVDSEGANYKTYFVHSLSGLPIRAYSAPKIASDVITEFSVNQRVKVIGRVKGDTVWDSDQWYKVPHNEHIVYIHNSDLSAEVDTPPITLPQQQSRASGPKLPKNINFNFPGYFIDGWADLVDGQAPLAQEVLNTTYQLLLRRKPGDIAVGFTDGLAGGVDREWRKFTVAVHRPNAYTTLYVAPHGQDLYVTWHSFAKGHFNWALIGRMALVAILVNGLTLVTGFSSLFSSSPYSRGFGNVLGVISFSAFAIGFLVVFVIECLIVMVAGYLARNENIFAFFWRDPHWFEAEDIVAMNLAVHRSVVAALKKAGVQDTLIRAKPSFKANRQGDTL